MLTAKHLLNYLKKAPWQSDEEIEHFLELVPPEGYPARVVLDMLEAFSAREDVVGDVEHVIRFVIGQMDLQQVQILVDGLDQSDAPGKQMH